MIHPSSVWTLIPSAPRACSLPSGLTLGMWCRATERLGVYDQLTARWPVARRGRYGTGFFSFFLCTGMQLRALLWFIDFSVWFFFRSSYRQTRDGFDWNHAVHCTPGCWVPPTCWKRNREEGKSGWHAKNHKPILVTSVCWLMLSLCWPNRPTILGFLWWQ